MHSAKVMSPTTWIALLLCGGSIEASEVLELTPDKGVQLAMESERLMMARSESAKAEEKVREARAEGMPKLDASIDYTRNWLLPTVTFDNNTFRIGNDNNAAGELKLTQPLYRGGGVRARLKAARLSVARATEMERAVRQRVMAEVETGFYDFLLAVELARVSELVLARARSNLTQVTALNEAGRASEYDLMRAEVRVSAVRSDSIRASNDLDLEKIRLKDAVGIDLDREIRVVAAFREQTVLDVADREGLLALGAARRPERRQLEQLSAIEEREIQIEKAEGRPSVDLVVDGRMQYQNDEFKISDSDEWRRSWSTRVKAEVPLFDGMRKGARVAQVREELRRLQYEAEKLDRSIELEIREAWLDLQEAEERIEARRGTVGQAARGLEIAESRYGSGAGTQLEILDAQLTLVEAETELAKARRDRAVSIVKLELSVGVLGEL